MTRNPISGILGTTTQAEALEPAADNSQKRKLSGTGSPRTGPQQVSGSFKQKIVSGYPIPYGNRPYARAKRAEYIEKNLEKAKYYYQKSIKNNDRAESAVKDLASLLHQHGMTSEAISLMERYKYLVTEEPAKYENLLNNLLRQSQPTGNQLNKILRIAGLKEKSNDRSISRMFKNPSRINQIEKHIIDGKFYVFLHFSSHSSARKTVETYLHFDKYMIEWVTSEGEVVGDANPARHKQEYRKKNPPFFYKLFERDPDTWVLPMPIDGENSDSSEESRLDELNGQLLLGSLYKDIIGEAD